MTRRVMVGLEYGDLSELWNLSAGVVIESTTVNSVNGGAYGIKIASSASPPNFQWWGGLNSSRSRAKIFWRTDSVAAPSADMYLELITFKDSAGTAGGSLWLKQLNADASFSLVIRDSSFVDVSTTAITVNANQWYCFEADCTKGAGTGAMTAYIDTVQTASVSSQAFGANNIDQLWTGFQSLSSSQSRNYYFDDLEEDDTNLCGLSLVLARQGVAGTPTDNGWNKSTGTSAAAVWSDTPVNAATFCNTNSTKNQIAQTMLTASFSTTQSGHGTGVIGASDTINGIKVGAFAKINTATAASGAVRRIFGGVATDGSSLSLTTADVLYESAIFTATLTNLNASEIGFDKLATASVRTVQVEDVWGSVSYTPAVADTLLAQAVM